MPGNTKPLRAALAALVAAFLASPAAAYVFILNPNTGIPAKWNPPTIPIRIMLGDTADLHDGSSFNTSARTAAESWNARMGAVQFTVALAGAGVPQQQNNNSNDLFFSPTIFGDAFEGTTIAVTLSFRNGNTRTASDVVFRSGDRTWNSYRGPRPSSLAVGTIDIQRVAIHELGHVLGLDHPNQAGQEVVAVMNSTVSQAVDALTSDDIEGIQRLYGPPGVPANDNFANAVVIDLGTATSISLPGHNTNATKEGGEPNHAGDAGGSSVWWRWTAPATGSVTLDTRGSVYDTTLGVYTGSSVSALTLVADDDDIQNGVVQASEVTFSATSGTTYHIAVDGWDGDIGGVTLNLSFQGAATSPPTITVQPLSLTVNPGNTATFTVVATGQAPLVYQWFVGGNQIAGANNPTLTINNVQNINAGNYHVTITNTGGSVTSNTVTLTVNQASTPPPSGGGGGGGGGGGAPSPWFLAALLLVGAARLLFTRRA